jgi:hypothetical protein
MYKTTMTRVPSGDYVADVPRNEGLGLFDSTGVRDQIQSPMEKMRWHSCSQTAVRGK